MKTLNESNFKPLRALVLVRRDAPETVKEGVIIPDNVKTYGWRATVLRSGPKATAYVKDEVILFLKEYTVLPFKDRTLALTDAEHVLARLEVAENVEVIVPQNHFVMIDPHDTVVNKGAIFLPDKAKIPPKSGCVVRKSIDCLDVNVGATVWYEPNKGVNCVEDGVGYKLIDESDIMAMWDGGAK